MTSRPGASRTAVLVCQGRAVADGRLAVGHFDDPVAELLLRPDERAAVERARTGVPPSGWADRVEVEMLLANAEVMAARTVAVDDAVLERPHPQLVVLGAGLDDRAWRLPDLGAVDVYEVDHPASQQDKRERSAELEPRARSVRFVPVDFGRDALGPALDAAGHRPDVPTTWLWEGVVPYLTRAQVRATVDAVAGRSAAGSRLVVAYQTPSLTAWAGLLLARTTAVVTRRPDPMRREPRRSSWTPTAMRDLLAGYGLHVVRDDDLLDQARRLDMPVRHPRSLGSGRVAVADRSSPPAAET